MNNVKFEDNLEGYAEEFVGFVQFLCSNRATEELRLYIEKYGEEVGELVNGILFIVDGQELKNPAEVALYFVKNKKYEVIEDGIPKPYKSMLKLANAVGELEIRFVSKPAVLNA